MTVVLASTVISVYGHTGHSGKENNAMFYRNLRLDGKHVRPDKEQYPAMRSPVSRPHSANEKSRGSGSMHLNPNFLIYCYVTLGNVIILA